MASNTARLNLLKKDPVVDALDTFNIKTMLNDNWDKIDSLVETVEGAETKIANAKSEAISAASTDATNKANAAEKNAKDYSIPLIEKGQSNGIATLDPVGVLVQKPYVTGTYTGDGASSKYINLGFTPSLLIVTGADGGMKDNTNQGWSVYYDGGMVTNGNPIRLNQETPTGNNTYTVLEIASGGFNVYSASFDSDTTNSTNNNKYIGTNSTSKHYYIAFR